MTVGPDRSYLDRGLFLFHCARGDPGAPSNHSSKATRFTILAPSLRSMRRLAPQCEHTRSRGRVSALMRPIWPHGHVTRISMELHPKIAPAQPGLKVMHDGRSVKLANQTGRRGTMLMEVNV
jgi:hypothetical protein